MAKQVFMVDNEPERQRMYSATDGDCMVTVEPLNTMTQKQRGALHVWLQMVADTLNKAGLPCVVKSVFDDGEIELDWTMGLAKERLYKYVLAGLTGKRSTEDQDTTEPSVVAEHIIRYCGYRGVVLPEWPSKRRPS